jgi:hypothetical protein
LMESNTGLVRVDGAAVIASFTDYDSLVAALRARIGEVGLSYAALEQIVGMCEGQVAKYLSDARVKQLSVGSLLLISEAVGVRGILVADERLMKKYRRLYTSRDGAKVHARRRAPLGAVTLRRVMSPVAAEMGRRGAIARNSKLTPEVRRELARAAARARWQRR